MKMNKKYLSFLILGLFVFSMLSVSLASAGFEDDVKEFMDSSISAVDSILRPILGYVLGDTTTTSGDLFLKTLVLLLALLFFFGALDAVSIFEGSQYKDWINGGIAAIFAIIGTRFLPADLLMALTAPSSALVATLFAMIPLVLLVAISAKVQNEMISKAIYWVFALMMFVIVVYNIANDFGRQFNWVYVGFAFIALGFEVMGIRKKLRKEILKSHSSQAFQTSTTSAITQLQGEIRNLEASLGNAPAAQVPQIKKDIKAKKEALKNLQDLL